MVQAFVGQAGTAVVKLFKKDGSETDSYDQASGVVWHDAQPGVIDRSDADADPLDCELLARAVGQTSFRVELDGDPGDGVRHLVFQSESIDVVQPPDEGAFSGEFTVVFEQIEA
jgi:hypothetical protein